MKFSLSTPGLRVWQTLDNMSLKDAYICTFEEPKDGEPLKARKMLFKVFISDQKKVRSLS